ncbi:alpha/beta hydrolase [Lacticaseibacillus suibinensis]|uniref:alpha/beta hydrolase n=1 Tax=Lacticaseibacillus suibinensis TaxID=2486011 RepID=UPI000F7854E1|nr:hypothetical protein [Lacticaseibacillus suibinensis]
MRPHEQFKAGAAGQPTLLLLHGIGGTENDLMPIGHFLAPHASLLSLRGQVTIQGRTQFFAASAEAAAIKTQVAWLTETVQARCRQYQLDPQTMIPVGYSNGADFALAALGSALPFPAAVLLHPTSPLPLKLQLAGKALWASHGAQDEKVSAPIFRALTQQIKASGGQLTVFHHDQRHNLNITELRQAKAWLTHFMEVAQ